MSEKTPSLFPFFAISLVLVLALSFPVPAQDYPPEILAYADLILHNGQVLTMDSDQPPINVTEAVGGARGKDSSDRQ